MQVILLEKMANLGELGDLVTVRPGYGRNFLIPRGKAAPATKENQKKFEARRAELEKQASELLVAAQARHDALANQIFTITAKAGEEGKLFGSVSAADIAAALNHANLTIEKHEVRLPSGPLRHTGEHEIKLHLHSDVDTTVKINVVAEE